MSDMFSVIASTMDDEHERNEGSRARIAATKRLEKRFLAYLSKASDATELDHRLAMIEAPAMKIVESACAEHRYAHPAKMFNEVVAALRAQAADVPTGDTYESERIDLGANDSGLQDEGSPKINMEKVPEGGLDPIEVPSVRHPLERQNIRDVPEYGDRHDGPEVADPTKGPRERVDAGEPMQPEHHVAPRTDTWSDKGNQASPVTSSVEPHWTVLD